MQRELQLKKMKTDEDLKQIQQHIEEKTRVPSGLLDGYMLDDGEILTDVKIEDTKEVSGVPVYILTVTIGDKEWLKMNRKAEIHQEITHGLHDLYRRKNHDYGDSFGKVRREVDQAIIVRLKDKISRLQMLLPSEGKIAKVNDESIDDTLRDLANYAILELVERLYERE